MVSGLAPFDQILTLSFRKYECCKYMLEKNPIVQRLARSIHYRVSKMLPPDYLGERYECPLCKTKLNHFTPLPAYYFNKLQENQFIHSIFQSENPNLENYLCPACDASDRDRLYCLYIEKFLQTAGENAEFNLLEIAPSSQLRKFLQEKPQFNYRSADLFMPDVDDKIDITNMQAYADGQFDVFVCSHVLEHVEDDNRAMRELYRILSHQGWGITMVPINLGLKEDYENSSITSESERWKHFGQDDHVRMYSKSGFVNKLKTAGFRVEELGVDYFGLADFDKYGIHPRTVLYIVKK